MRSETALTVGEIVCYQDCLWMVWWVRDGECGIQSLGGTESIKVKVSEVTR